MKKMKWLLSAAILACGIGFGSTGVSAQSVAQADAVQSAPIIASRTISGKVLDPYVIELPTFTHVDFDALMAADREMFGKMACSAVAKVLPNGDMVVGRSMDLAFSDRPVYILRTATPGCYKTIGISYNPFSGPSFEEVTQKGISQEQAVRLLAFSEDVFNEKGLYIEGDMRMQEPASTGIRPTTGTHPEAEYRMSLGLLIRFLAERAATVEEALALAKTIDIHDLVSDDFRWGGGFLIADAMGHFGVLEVVDNKLVWTDGQRAHANFYVAPEYSEKTLFKCGMGRYDVLMGGIDAVKTEDDMARLIYKVRFSQLLDPDTSEFDPRSDFEEIDPAPYHKAGITNTTEALAEENREKVMAIMREIGAKERAKSPEQLKAEGKQWISAFQTVVNCNQGTLSVLFFENPQSVHVFMVE